MNDIDMLVGLNNNKQYKIGCPVQGKWSYSIGDYVPTEFKKMPHSNTYCMYGYHIHTPNIITLRSVGAFKDTFTPIYKKDIN